MNLDRKDFQSIKSNILNQEITVTSITQDYLARIRKDDHYHAFLTNLEDRSLNKAKSIDQRIANGNAGKLAGMIIGIKDNLVMKNVVTTAGSKILENYVPPYNATVIDRLEAEDAICIGKTNMDEFGMGSSTENSAFGPVKNPHDPERIPGGSSGGSAAAVAANLCMTALGTDTGGSVRQPAALTGVMGLRPTYGRISRYGLIAFASSLDTVGIFSHTTRDCADILAVIAGHDTQDSTSVPKPLDDYHSLMQLNLKNMRIGVPKEYMESGLDPIMKESIHVQIDKMTAEGAQIVDISLPMTEYALATYYLICTAEASSNLARYDGVKYGLSVGRKDGLQSMYKNTRHDGFGDEVKRRIMLGTYVLSSGYYDAYYLKAQKARTVIRQDFENAFDSCDIIIGPTTPTTAFKLGEKSEDPLQMYLSDILTVSAPLAGLPALSVPIGTDDQDLPMGLQITGLPFMEAQLLRLARWIETHDIKNRLSGSTFKVQD